MSATSSARSLLLALALAAGAAPSLGCSHHGGVASSPAAQSITVVGRGEARARPDLARVMLGVETRAATVAEANRITNERLAQVVAAVRGLGIAEADVRTSNYAINFERFYPQEPPTPYGAPMPYGAPGMAPDMAPAPAPPPGPAPRSGGGKVLPAPGAAASSAAPAPSPAPAPSAAPSAMPPAAGQGGIPGVYRVANTIEITIRDITKVAGVLDGAVSTGANEVQGVFFDIDDRKPQEAKVRELAVADARSRAEALAKLHGKTLGGVVAVSEVVTDVSHPMFAPMPMMARDAAAGGAQIAPGELTVTGQIQVVYAFEE